MESLSNLSVVRALGGITHNSSKTVLDTLQLRRIKSRETPKQEIAVVKLTTNQSIYSHKSSITCEVSFEVLKISDLSKSGLTVL